MQLARAFPLLTWLVAQPCFCAEDDPLETRLEELTVTAHRTETHSVPPIETLDSKDIDRRAVRIGPDALASFTSLSLSRAGAFGSQSQVRVRGAEANHLQVLIDGIEVNDPATGSEFSFAHLDLSGIGSIEFLPGAQSALWGSDALAGVLQLISAREASTTRVELSTGSNREVYGSLEFGRELESGHYRLSFSDYRTDGSNTAIEGDEDDGYEHRSAHFSARMGGEALGLSLVLRQVSALSEFDPSGFPTYLPIDGDNQSAMRLRAGKIGLDAELFAGRLEQSVEFKHLGTRTLTDVEDQRISSFEGERNTLTSLSHFHLSERHLLTGLVEYEREGFEQAAEVGFFGDPNHAIDVSTKSAALEYLATWGAFRASLSARHDTHSAFQDINSYRLAARYFVRPTLSFFASLGTGTKNPSFIERYGYTPDSFIGNPNLRPEYNRHASLGLDWRPSASSGFAITLFDDKLVDEINGFAWNGAGFTALNLDGTSQRKGFELRSRAKIREIQLSLAYTWVDSNAPDGTAEVRRPRHQGHISLARTWLDDRLELLLGARVHSKNLDLDFSTGQQRVVDLPKRELVYLASRYAFSDAFSMILRMENALDDRGQEVYGFVPRGRTFSIGVRASW